MCIQKIDMRVSIYDLNGNVLLEDNWVSIGRKVTSMAVISLK
jgi:hypothetical protein